MRRAARAPLTGLALLGLLAGAAPASAQGSAELTRVVERVGGAWARGDAAAVVAYAAAEGVSLELEDGSSGPLGKRQAAAALRRLFDRGETQGVRTGMAHVVGGQPPRGFGEIAWLYRPDGTSEAERRTVFLGLVVEDGEWRVTQIRLLR